MNKEDSFQKSMKFLLIFIVSFLLSLSFLRSGIEILIFLILLFLMTLSFQHSHKAIHIYFVLLPFFPFYLGIDFGLFGEINGVTMLNLICLLPLLMRLILAQGLSSKGGSKYNGIDLLVLLFIVTSSFYQLANYGFMIWKGRMWHDIVDFLLLYFVVSRSIVSEKQFGKILKTIVIGGCLFVLLSIVDYLCGLRFYTQFVAKFLSPLLLSTNFGPQETIRADVPRLQSSFGQPISLAIYLCVLLMLTFGLFDKKLPFRQKCLYFFTSIIAILGLFLTQSRGPILISFVLTILFYFFIKQTRLFIIGVLIVLGLIFSVLGMNLSFNSERLVEKAINWNIGNTKNLNYRIELYDNVLSKIEKVSFIGENRTLFKSLSPRFQLDTVIWYMQVLVDNGIVTFVIFLALIYSLLNKGRMLFFKYKVTIVFPLFSMLLCFLAVSFVGQSVYYFWVVAALTVAAARIYNSGRE